MSKLQIVKGITDNLANTPYVEGKVYFVYNDVASTDLSIYADIDGARRKITPVTFEEEDPTVPDWAKRETKPTYTAAEIGALPDTTVIPRVYSSTNTNGYLTMATLPIYDGTVE